MVLNQYSRSLEIMANCKFNVASRAHSVKTAILILASNRTEFVYKLCAAVTHCKPVLIHVQYIQYMYTIVPVPNQAHYTAMYGRYWTGYRYDTYFNYWKSD